GRSGLRNVGECGECEVSPRVQGEDVLLLLRGMRREIQGESGKIFGGKAKFRTGDAWTGSVRAEGPGWAQRGVDDDCACEAGAPGTEGHGVRVPDVSGGAGSKGGSVSELRHGAGAGNAGGDDARGVHVPDASGGGSGAARGVPDLRHGA